MTCDHVTMTSQAEQIRCRLRFPKGEQMTIVVTSVTKGQIMRDTILAFCVIIAVIGLSMVFAYFFGDQRCLFDCK